jgi:hypothetical protein
MSFVEDARKLLQDFVAPELRGINQRLDDLIAGMEKSFAEVEKLANERQQTSEKLAVERHGLLLDRMESLRRELTLAIDLALANRKIEELLSRQSGTATH